MSNEITTIEIDTFSKSEMEKVFVYFCREVAGKNVHWIKEKVLHTKRGEIITWDHVMKLVYIYGLNPKLTFSHDPNESHKKITWRQANMLRLQKGLKALPPTEVETLD